MNRQSYYYSKTPIAQISEGLNKIFTSLRRESSDSYVRSASSNMIIPVTPGTNLDELDVHIDELSLLSPARFFVIVASPAGGEIEAQITARCHGLGAAQHVCCEVVRLLCPEDKGGALAEIVRANVVPGMSTRLFLYDPAVAFETIDRLTGLCDQVIYDSREFEERFDTLSYLLAIDSALIDMQWVATGLWREQVKQAWQRQALQEYFDALTTVTISAECASRELCSAMLLMGGWMVQSLQLEAYASKGKSEFSCRMPKGSSVRLKLEPRWVTGSSRLTRVEFHFKRSAADVAGLTLERSDKLEVIVSLKQNYVSAFNFEDETRWGLLKRYFQVGEQLDGYLDALRNAVDLKTLSEEG